MLAAHARLETWRVRCSHWVGYFMIRTEAVTGIPLRFDDTS
jgi:hypothetical protein